MQSRYSMSWLSNIRFCGCSHRGSNRNPVSLCITCSADRCPELPADWWVSADGYNILPKSNFKRRASLGIIPN